MKRIVLIALVGMAFTFTACKKDWTCVCPYDESYMIYNKTKNKADKQCTEAFGVPVPGMTNISTNNCSLK